MKIAMRIPDRLLARIHVDLSRHHRFAFERVGFVGCRQAALLGGIAFLAEAYFPVADPDYLESNSIGALMGPAAIRKAMQLAYDKSYSMFHVHRHEHKGAPKFSPLDLRESAKFIPDFWNVRPNIGHGALVLSHDSMFGLAWDPVDKLRKPIQEFAVVGRPLKYFGGRYG